ncbi:hypothetical protein BDF14DRAFT_1746991 [Spinellus fusiger]|nr:hypothetical protein BDF14DRAFT_1746991 [Spinellus fusiger]
MLALAEQHSYALGFRWNPSKCVVLNHPSPLSSTACGYTLSLYGVPLTQADEVTYLGLPFGKKGLIASSLVSSLSPGVAKVIGILSLIGVSCAGFSLLLCSRIYSTFVCPKFEYGLAISFLKAQDHKALEQLQDWCLCLLVGGHPT